MKAEVQVEHRVDWGLRLPDGTEIWHPETFHGRAVDTPENRRVIAEALEHSSKNLGFGESSRLLDEYHWIARETQIIIIERPLEQELRSLNDPGAVGVSSSEEDSPDEVVDTSL